jgi:hypothetical protein
VDLSFIILHCSSLFFILLVDIAIEIHLYTCLNRLIMREQAEDELELGNDVNAMASTGIAAILLPGGLAYHEWLGSPLNTAGCAVVHRILA